MMLGKHSKYTFKLHMSHIMKVRPNIEAKDANPVYNANLAKLIKVCQNFCQIVSTPCFLESVFCQELEKTVLGSSETGKVTKYTVSHVELASKPYVLNKTFC